MDDIIKLKKINKFYGDKIKTQVLFDIDLSIKNSSFNSIIGASGSGKSTLLNILGTLDRPTSGEVYVNDILTSDLDKNKLSSLRNETIGFIFQFHYLLKEFSALENIMLPALIAGATREEALQRAGRLVSEVGLEEREHHYPAELSGGERQRVAAARALVNDPLIILADEPTGNLDEGNSRIVEDLLFSLVRKRGRTLLLVTHDRALAGRGDRRFGLHRGELVPE